MTTQNLLQAELSKAAYDVDLAVDVLTGHGGLYTASNGKTYRVVDDFTSSDPENGYAAYAFQEEVVATDGSISHVGDVYLANRGTEFFEDFYRDVIVADTQIFFDDLPSDGGQLDSAIQFAREMQAVYGDSLVLTGHSSGGTFAQAQSLVTGLDAYSYNGPGIGGNEDFLLTNYGELAGDGSNIVNYIDPHDPIGRWGDHLGVTYQVGSFWEPVGLLNYYTFYYVPIGTILAVPEVLEQHSIENLISEMITADTAAVPDFEIPDPSDLLDVLLDSGDAAFYHFTPSGGWVLGITGAQAGEWQFGMEVLPPDETAGTEASVSFYGNSLSSEADVLNYASVILASVNVHETTVTITSDWIASSAGTVAEVASINGISVSQLLALNPSLSEGGLVSAGDVLALPSGVTQYNIVTQEQNALLQNSVETSGSADQFFFNDSLIAAYAADAVVDFGGVQRGLAELHQDFGVLLGQLESVVQAEQVATRISPSGEVDFVESDGSRFRLVAKDTTGNGEVDTVEKRVFFGDSDDAYLDVALRDTNGDGIISLEDTGADIEVHTQGEDYVSGAEIGAAFGSALGQYMAGDNAISQVVIGSVTTTFFESIGDTIEGLIDGESFSEAANGDGTTPGGFSGFGERLGVRAANLAIGQVSSFIVGEVIGGDSLAADFGRSVANYAVSTTISHYAFAEVAQQGVSVGTPSFNFADPIAGFFASQLASSIVTPETQEAALVSSALGAVGAAFSGSISSALASIGIAFPGIGTFVGVLVGQVIGSLLGNLIFGSPGTPHAFASINLGSDGKLYVPGVEWSENNADVQAAIDIATGIKDGLNPILDLMGGDAHFTGNIDANWWLEVGYRGGNYQWNKPGVGYTDVVGFDNLFDDVSAEVVMNRLAGGDGLARRVYHYGSWTTTREFMVELQIASDYRTYLDNRAVIDALIEEAPDSAFSIGWLTTISQAAAMGLTNPDALQNKIEGTSGNDVINGTVFNDEIIGGAGDDTLDGGDGNDLLRGGAGNDTLRGGAGQDSVSYAEFTSGVVIDLLQMAVTGAGGADNLESIERAFGSQGNDTIIGSHNADILSGLAGNDSVQGWGGDDTIEGGAGADGLDGGDGFDLVTYAGSDVGVKVSLASGTGEGGDAQGDTLANFEGIIGSLQSDILTGDAGDNFLFGSGGNDFLEGGAGADDLMGGDGADFAVYSNSAQAVAINLEIGVISGGEAEGDTFDSIEYVIGSAHNDTIIGDAIGNVIEGGAGADYLDGGAGMDAISYASSSAGVHIDLVNQTASGGDADGDTISNFEHIIGSNFDDVLTVGAENAIVLAGAGDDVIIPYNGNVAIDGGDGYDMASFEAVDNAGNFQPLFQSAGLFTGFQWGETVVYQGDDIYSVWNQVLEGASPDDGLFSADTERYQIKINSIEALRATEFDDIISFNDIGQNVYGGGGNDEMVGRAGNDFFDGESGNDKLIGADGDDTLKGGDGDDLLYGDAESDLRPAIVIPTNSSDVTYSLAPGSDVLDGGAGNDTLKGYLGDDVYIFGRGYGHDVVYDQGYQQQLTIIGKGPALPDALVDAGSDTLQFGADIAGSDIAVRQIGNDLEIRIIGEDDKITLKNWTESFRRVEKFHFTETGQTFDWTGVGIGTVLSTFASFTEGTNGNDGLTSTSVSYTMFGLDGADVLNGYAGNDSLSGNGGNDTLHGNDGNDRLYGGAGDDVIYSGSGADHVDGGSGEDGAWYNTSGSAVTIDLMLGTASGGDAEGDMLISIERLHGSAHNDSLTGTDGVNLLWGGGGDDTLTGHGGDDHMYGQTGHDTLFGGAGDDHLNGDSGNDHLHGGAGNDMLYGGSGLNGLWGGDGDDVLYAGVDADHVDGGSGEDGAWYNTSGSAVTIDLMLGTASGGDAEGDMLVSIERLHGSAHNDSLTGTDGVNLLWGGGGDDTLTGHGGDDHMYGQAGADTLHGGAGNDHLNGDGQNDYLYGDAGNDYLYGGDGADLIDGGNGNDTAGYVNSGAGVSINLAAGTASGGYADGDTLVGIEHVIGSNHDDVLVGDGQTNVLQGLGGNDVLEGGAGADTLDGGDGFDTASYVSSGTGVSVDLSTGSVSGGDAAGDILTSVEGLYGSAHDDVLIGAAGTNHLYGGGGHDTINGDAGDDALFGDAGNDTLQGGAGADHLNGGDGIDIASYESSASAVTVNLATGTGVGGDAEGDVLSYMEWVYGSAFDDTLTGDASHNGLYGREGNDYLLGGAGNDALYGEAGNDTLRGGAGADHLDGGAGIDIVHYDFSTAGGITLDLAAGTGLGGDAQGDVLVGIENVFATHYADSITGDANANTLYGNGGADAINGGAGDDHLIGGVGADGLDGGSGSDTVRYDNSDAGVSIDLAAGTASGGYANGDTFINIENVVGSAHNDVLVGDGQTNVLQGLGGNDVLEGGGGGDTLDGGDGLDHVEYRGSALGVTVNLATGVNTGGDAEGDQLSNIEALVGSYHNDVLTGNDALNILHGELGDDFLYGQGGDDQLYGWAGHDVLDGGAGADVIDGGGDIDTVEYRGSALGVTVNLTTGVNTGGDAEGDQLSNIEALVGSYHNDVLTGNDALNILHGELGDDFLYGQGGDDQLYGWAGNDVIYSGSGADHVDGGSGEDGAWYNTSGSAVTIDLMLGTASGGDAEGDMLVSIERLHGSAHNDSLTGTDGVNLLWGGGGDDTLTGHGGDDHMYGQAGADTLHGGAGNDHLNGDGQNDYLYGDAGNDYLYGGDGADLIDGGNGNDTAGYVNSGAGVSINLAAGTASGGYADGDTLVGIEHVIGSNHDDVLVGDGQTNVLQGLGGNDVLEGGAGADTLDGGDGFDTASYVSSGTGVSVDLSTGSVSGGDAAGDILTSVEGLYGSAHDDVLIGAAGTNHLYGGGGHDTINGDAGDDALFGDAGNDTLQGGAGADHLNGGDGIDIASYESSASAVTVNLATGTGVGGDAEGDVLSYMEWVYGSAFDDTLTGDASHNGLYGREGNDYLLGGAGNDALYGEAGNDTLRGGAGADHLDGGAGIDIVHYDFSTAGGITLDLAAGTGLGGDAQGDVLVGIENVFATHYADSITGDANANTLYGNGGADAINGGAGDDHLIGGVGADGLDGGSGSDTVRYDNSDAGVSIDLAAGTASGGYANGDTFINIENVVGSAHNDVLVGDGQTNVLQGLGGNDVLEGGGGGDTLDGGDGLDHVEYRGSALGVTVNLATGVNTGGDAEGDQLSNIEALVGSYHNDVLTGNDALNILHGELGDDFLYGQGGDDQLYGWAGHDVLDGGAGADVIDGGGDIDTVEYRGSALGVTVNLTTGVNTGGDAEGDQLSNIEALVGSYHNDVLTGNDALNILHGELGDDFLYGQGGDDQLYGWAGNDVIYSGSGADHVDGGSGEDGAWYNTSGSAVTIDLMLGTASGGDAEGDMLVSIERLHGSAHNDSLTGTDGVNLLWGGGGDDTLTGHGGDDHMYGQAGADTLHGGAGNDHLNGDGQNDYLYGDAGNDYLYGGDGADLIDGGNGNDVLDGGGGLDAVNGGNGFDTASYVGSGAGVSVNLSTSSAFGGDAEGDALTSIEGLYGSAHDDVLIGEAGVNHLYGGNGHDTVEGGAGDDALFGDFGDDTLEGGLGNDLLGGGAGFDTYIFGRGDGADLVSQSGAGAAGGRLSFASAISHDQLWFSQAGGDLHVSVIGTSDGVTIDGYFTAANREVTELLAGGLSLDTSASSSAVQNLVSAMAAFAPPSTGTLDLPQNIRDDQAVSSALAAWVA